MILPRAHLETEIFSRENIRHLLSKACRNNLIRYTWDGVWGKEVRRFYEERDEKGNIHAYEDITRELQSYMEEFSFSPEIAFDDEVMNNELLRFFVALRGRELIYARDAMPSGFSLNVEKGEKYQCHQLCEWQPLTNANGDVSIYQKRFDDNYYVTFVKYATFVPPFRQEFVRVNERETYQIDFEHRYIILAKSHEEAFEEAYKMQQNMTVDQFEQSANSKIIGSGSNSTWVNPLCTWTEVK